ncbi:glycosyltransferase [Chitinibacter sp. SCUT-21]|uniref:glycosyltransferase family 2 protein n=1 Tax=Chitinibacter sp. SCUT-21 TaxID=2970891 RepID=UPI0035A635EB
MPSYNQAQFIEYSVRSVLSQPVGSLFVADGGSRDGTVAILKRLQAEFGSRLIFVSEPDQGPASAINKALRLAQDDIIGWLNSDDLYTPGTVEAVLAAFAQHPDWQMLYGEANHIDAFGQVIDRYPTLPPSIGIDAFRAGCFICQPTVFLRREVFDRVGLLDETIATAFDFEYWLRIFSAFPDQIGFIPQCLALSRLHDDCITVRLREQVAVDGIRVIARHLGQAPITWLATLTDELLSRFPFGASPPSVADHVARLADSLKEELGEAAVSDFKHSLQQDSRLRLAQPDCYVEVFPDAWVGPQFQIRLGKWSRGARWLSLSCLNLFAHGPQFSIALTTSWGRERKQAIPFLGPFKILIPLPAAPLTDAHIDVLCSCHFVPQLVDSTSDDARQLCFKVLHYEIC